MRNFVFPALYYCWAYGYCQNFFRFFWGYRNPRLGFTHFSPPPSPLWSAYLSQCLLFPTQMNRVKCTFSTQANMEGGGIIFTCLNIFFCHFSYGNMKKASRITNNILIIIIKWSGAGGYGWPVSPLSRHCLYFCVHTQLQYVYNRITVRLGPRNSKNKVSVHSWQIYSTSWQVQNQGFTIIYTNIYRILLGKVWRHTLAWPRRERS